MTERKIPASITERHMIGKRMADAERAEAMSKHATAVATDVFTMFCEGHSVSGATYVGIDEEHVIVTVPEQAPAKPELVKEA